MDVCITESDIYKLINKPRVKYINHKAGKKEQKQRICLTTIHWLPWLLCNNEGRCHSFVFKEHMHTLVLISSEKVIQKYICGGAHTA